MLLAVNFLHPLTDEVHSETFYSETKHQSLHPKHSKKSEKWQSYTEIRFHSYQWQLLFGSLQYSPSYLQSSG
jgi:hypothetical protein